MSFSQPLQCHHNDHDGVLNHQPHGCLLNRLFRRRSKRTSKLRVTGLCVGNSPRPVNFHTKGQLRGKCFHLMTSSRRSASANCGYIYCIKNSKFTKCMEDNLYGTCHICCIKKFSPTCHWCCFYTLLAYLPSCQQHCPSLCVVVIGCRAAVLFHWRLI